MWVYVLTLLGMEAAAWLGFGVARHSAFERFVVISLFMLVFVVVMIAERQQEDDS